MSSFRFAAADDLRYADPRRCGRRKLDLAADVGIRGSTTIGVITRCWLTVGKRTQRRSCCAYSPRIRHRRWSGNIDIIRRPRRGHRQSVRSPSHWWFAAPYRKKIRGIVITESRRNDTDRNYDHAND